MRGRIILRPTNGGKSWHNKEAHNAQMKATQLNPNSRSPATSRSETFATRAWRPRYGATRPRRAGSITSLSSAATRIKIHQLQNCKHMLTNLALRYALLASRHHSGVNVATALQDASNDSVVLWSTPCDLRGPFVGMHAASPPRPATVCRVPPASRRGNSPRPPFSTAAAVNVLLELQTPLVGPQLALSAAKVAF
jgi:hypothetical protein